MHENILPFHPGPIADVIVRRLSVYDDKRGWLCELFRNDELAGDLVPAMAYVSATLPGEARGPHEHLQQTDHFCFLGPATFHLHLWDNRPESPTYLCHEIAILPGDQPMTVTVPPGVVHAYRNVGVTAGLTWNAPNRLYRGEGRADPVDEIRHEDDLRTPFRLIQAQG
ncbi:MAG: dTDP-4-dehydrorhamnose 3,5-epimerase [Gemmataceae bacterium]|nr:dTDP-4-dehydrorhamnose 3,5-epimerase [Gemmataceae bacterium]